MYMFINIQTKLLASASWYLFYKYIETNKKNTPIICRHMYATGKIKSLSLGYNLLCVFCVPTLHIETYTHTHKIPHM